MKRLIRIATRGSRLALRQVELVADLLGVDVEPVVISTVGDRRVDVPLRAIAGSGAFTGEVRAALAAGAADLAVHSAKDLPAADDSRFATAYPARADARDALIGGSLAELPVGGTVATGAPRRRAQLHHVRPDVRVVELRGNIETRLAKTGDEGVDAIIVAVAALDRLGIRPELPVEFLAVDEFVPQVGQGALAVDARSDEPRAQEWLKVIDDSTTRLAVTAERAFLAALGGDCDLPAGAHAMDKGDGIVGLRAFLADGAGHFVTRLVAGRDPRSLGATAASELRDELAAIQARTVA